MQCFLGLGLGFSAKWMDLSLSESRRTPCQLIAQSSLGREDSSASLSKLEEESINVSMDEWEKIANMEAKKAALQKESSADDRSRQLAQFSDALESAASVLRNVAERNVQLELEVAEWKSKYELQLHRKNGKCETIAEHTQQIKEEIQPKQILSSGTDVEEPSTVKNPSSPKASFRLMWGPDGDNCRRHKHDIVSYEFGNISAAIRSSKQITLIWESTPKSVCIVTRPNSTAVQRLCKEMILWLKLKKDMVVFVEPRVRDELLADTSEFDFVQTWGNDEAAFLHKKVDLLITLGGDGTVLWAASLFKGPVPPVVSFSMGSLGFMTAFHCERYQDSLEHVMEGPVYITLRHRLQCRILKHDSSSSSSSSEVHLVLNELSIDRGMSSCLTNLECYCDNVFVTSVQGDGLIVSTTSGSTAYSLAAGGSMVHPHVPGILFTPICPHSLSFRPLILPGYVTLKVQVPVNSRGHAWASFDGKDRVELSGGDAVVCQMAAWPVPTASMEESTHHFLCTVRERLHWNLRKHQSDT